MTLSLTKHDFAVLMNPDQVDDDDADDFDFEVEYDDDFDPDAYNDKFGNGSKGGDYDANEDLDDDGDELDGDELDGDELDGDELDGDELDGDELDGDYEPGEAGTGEPTDGEGEKAPAEDGAPGVGSGESSTAGDGEGETVADAEGGETHDNDDDVDAAPEDLFGEMKFDVPKFDGSVANEVADTLMEEAKMEREKLGKAEADRTPYTPHPDAGAERVLYDEHDSNASDRFQAARADVAATSRAIAAQMRRVLSARSQSRVQRDQLRGTLDRTKLHTLNLPGRVRPNRNVFTTTVQGTTQRVAVGVLVDQSGSMSWNKIACARSAAVALGDALHSLSGLGIKFGVYGFDSHYDRQAKDYHGVYDRLDTLRIHHYKGFDENWSMVGPRVGAMTAHHCNPDNEAIRYVAGELMKVENVDRRVLLVLSDGEPATVTGRYDGDARLHADTKLAVKQCGELGIETLGIGICSTAVKRFYPAWVVINSANELERVIMDGLKGALGIAKGVAA